MFIMTNLAFGGKKKSERLHNLQIQKKIETSWKTMSAFMEHEFVTC